MNPKDGPKAALRLMRRHSLKYLPVTSRGGFLEGMVSLQETILADKKGYENLQDFIDKDAPVVSPDTYIHDLIPLYINEEMPISVVDENRKFLGIVSKATAVSIVMGEEYVTQDDNIVPKEAVEER